MKNNKKFIVPLLIAIFFSSIASFILYFKDANRLSEKLNPLIEVFRTLDTVWYDFKLRNKAPEFNQSKVLIAEIDDKSLELWGRWPWPRGTYNAIIHALIKDLGAEVVSFDAVFSEPEFKEKEIIKTFERVPDNEEKKLKEIVGLDDEKVKYLADNLSIMGDSEFGEAVHTFKDNVVLGYAWEGRESCPVFDSTRPPEDLKHLDLTQLTKENLAEFGYLHPDTYVDRLGTLINQSFKVEGYPQIDASLGTRQSQLYAFACPIANRINIVARSKYQGFFNNPPDNDGIFRRSLMVTALDAPFVPKESRDFLNEDWFKHLTFFPSLTLQSLVAYFKASELKAKVEKNEKGQLVIKSISLLRPNQKTLEIETLEDGTLPINFYGNDRVEHASLGNKKVIPSFSLTEIISLRDKAEDFKKKYGLNKDKPLKGKIIFIGPTALGVYDLRPNPVGSNSPGVALHATSTSRLVEYFEGNTKSFYTYRFLDWKIALVILWLMGLGLGIFMARSTALQGALVVTLLVGIFALADFFIFTRYQFVLDSMSIVVVVSVIFLTIFTYKYFSEEKDRAFVKQAFEKYVSPDLIGEIMQDPKKLNLGGQKKTLSVLFSDVRGFTTISEKLSAEELAQFMNEYLTPMTDMVQANKGTIDKYMGDAIMAIFGAPLPYENHPQKAVDAGLDMIEKLKVLNNEWRAKGLPPVDIGVGVNTGDMSVGNMGSQKIFSYTVMGDAVNLGSRVEGLTKEFGTKFLITEFTKQYLGPEYICREVNKVKVKGKNEPVRMFEVMAKGSNKEKEEIKALFEEALRLYYARDFEGAKKMLEDLASLDDVSKKLIECCDTWLNNPPPADWDGSWTMKTK